MTEDKQIPVMRPVMPSAESVAPFLGQMDASREYTNFGPLVRQLESAYAQMLGLPDEQVVSVSSATQGLSGVMTVLPPNKWIVPDFTFPATALAASIAGLELVFGDVLKETWALDPDVARSNPDAGIVPVMPFGAPIDLDSWAESEFVVIDAAASLGAENDLSCMPDTWCAVFSLHATKVLPAGEGGLVAFGSPDIAQEFRSWTNFGFRGQRSAQRAGTNAKMSEIHAAYGLASLGDWRREQRDWETAHNMADAIAHHLDVKMQPSANQKMHPYWILDLENGWIADLVEQKLNMAGVGTRRWWGTTCSQMPAFAHVPRTGSLERAYHLAQVTLGLPMFRDIREIHLQRIQEVLGESLRWAREVGGK